MVNLQVRHQATGDAILIIDVAFRDAFEVGIEFIPPFRDRRVSLFISDQFHG